MKVGSLGFVGCALVGALALPAAAAGSLSYDDPGMHFKAPDGWQRVDLPNADAGDQDHKPPAAVFVLNPGRRDQRTIVLDIQSGSDSLDAFEHGHESELHQQGDNGGAHVDKRTQVTLANGMPAYLLQVTSGDGLDSVRRYEYLVFDGQRDIDVSYSGHQGEFDQKAALDALSSLYVVAYPRNRS
ncbi:MAG: hypothetical protein GIW94_03105 [Candidatus Eremiobacteraeota bacterium]|nr:hypothetical protein [Candidatus Eremiobacteraeota bacterium]MBC5820505.1 hypothetical protein [Candidatus Eremiobacteraeota bacterium]